MKTKSVLRLYQILIIPFALMISFAIAITGYFTWQYSESFALDSGKHINEQTINSIKLELDYFFHHAALENNSLNQVISHGLLDISDTAITYEYMQQTLQPSLTKGVIDNLHIGFPNGNYLGVENIDDGVLKRIANKETNNALQIRDLKNNLIYQQSDYKVDEAIWYKNAKINHAVSWSNVYPIIGTDKLGITLSEPVYDKDNQLLCVIGSDILLSQFNRHIYDIQPTDNSYLFVFDEHQQIIAHSADKNYPVKFELSTLSKSNQVLLQQARNLFVDTDTATEFFDIVELTVDGVTEKYWISRTPYGYEQGLNWQIGVIIPESDLFGHVRTVEIRTFAIWLVAFIICVIVGLMITSFINYAIQHLAKRVHSVEKTATMFEHENSSIKEVNDLSVAFSHMSKQVLEMFLDLKNSNKTLENMVEQRTKELQLNNENLMKLTKLDDVTQLLNRLALEDILNEQWQLFKNQNIKSLACFSISLNCFKEYNDVYGQNMGDQYLQDVAKILLDINDEVGSVLRLTGVNFMIITSNLAMSHINKMAQDIIEEVTDLDTQVTTDPIAIGISSTAVHHCHSVHQLIDIANEALKEAKKQDSNDYIIGL